MRAADRHVSVCVFLMLNTGSHIEFTIAHSSICVPNYKFSERPTSVRIALRCIFGPNVASVSAWAESGHLESFLSN